LKSKVRLDIIERFDVLSFKFVRKFKFCVSPLVKRYTEPLTTNLATKIRV